MTRCHRGEAVCGEVEQETAQFGDGGLGVARATENLGEAASDSDGLGPVPVGQIVQGSAEDRDRPVGTACGVDREAQQVVGVGNCGLDGLLEGCDGVFVTPRHVGEAANGEGLFSCGCGDCGVPDRVGDGNATAEVQQAGMDMAVVVGIANDNGMIAGVIGREGPSPRLGHIGHGLLGQVRSETSSVAVSDGLDEGRSRVASICGREVAA